MYQQIGSINETITKMFRAETLTRCEWCFFY